MATRFSQQGKQEVCRIPVETLPAGEIFPGVDPQHVTRRTLAGWNDAFAPKFGRAGSSCKESVEYQGRRALFFSAIAGNRSLVTESMNWREYSVRCTLKQLDADSRPNEEAGYNRAARAGIVFRMETSRRHFYYCIEGQRRLVLYRRIDDEWLALAEQTVDAVDRIITLAVELLGDGIRASCPELDASFFVTDAFTPCGRVGFCSCGKSMLFDFEIVTNPVQRRINDSPRWNPTLRQGVGSDALPEEAEVGVMTVPEGARIITFPYGMGQTDYCRAGRNDLLFATDSGLLATTRKGERIWENQVKPQGGKSIPEGSVILSTDRLADGSRLIYCLAGARNTECRVNRKGVKNTRSSADELVVVNGRNGEVAARTKIPDDPYGSSGRMSRFALSAESGDLTGQGAFDIVLKKDCGYGEYPVWAYDRQLELLWNVSVMPPYGHANSVHLMDLNRDGRAEVLVGGTLLGPDGSVIWVHDLMDEMMRYRVMNPARGLPEHYDAVVAGFFDGYREETPVVFLISGTCGVYTVAGDTGKTLSCHRIGHAQWGMPCRVRPDIPGCQALVGTRGGGVGIMTLISARGERLWSLQPDFILQNTCPVQWLTDGPQHIWHNTTPECMGLYDGEGRLVSPLKRMRRLLEGSFPGMYQCLRLPGDSGDPDLLGVRVGQRIHVFASKS